MLHSRCQVGRAHGARGTGSLLLLIPALPLFSGVCGLGVCGPWSREKRDISSLAFPAFLPDFLRTTVVQRSRLIEPSHPDRVYSTAYEKFNASRRIFSCIQMGLSSSLPGPQLQPALTLDLRLTPKRSHGLSKKRQITIDAHMAIPLRGYSRKWTVLSSLFSEPLCPKL